MELTFEGEFAGQGSSGRIWKATDRLGRSLAVKFFVGTDPAVNEREAVQHASALARVSHPNVVALYALEQHVCPDDNQTKLAIVMEFVDGCSLNKIVSPIDPSLAVATIQQISAGLTAIHDVGLVHGDLNAANVMVAKSGSKLIDILYTHSLRDVGQNSAERTRQQDIHAFTVICQELLEKAKIEATRVADAYRAAFSMATTPEQVATTFLEVLLADSTRKSDTGRAASSDPMDALLFERTRQVVGQARAVFTELLRASGRYDSTYSEEDVVRVFEATGKSDYVDIFEAAVSNGSAPNFQMIVNGRFRTATWLEFFTHQRGRSRDFHAKILSVGQFLDREHAARLARLEQCSYFVFIESGAAQLTNAPPKWLAGPFWDYCQLAIQLGQYAELTFASRPHASES